MGPTLNVNVRELSEKVQVRRRRIALKVFFLCITTSSAILLYTVLTPAWPETTIFREWAEGNIPLIVCHAVFVIMVVISGILAANIVGNTLKQFEDIAELTRLRTKQGWDS